MAVAATGFFDGVHLGHRKVVETLVRVARERGEESLILTFWPHPRVVLSGGQDSVTLLNGMEEKKKMLRCLGVDRIEVIPFTPAFAALTAREYLRMVSADYSVDAMVLGYDTRIGSDRLGPGELSDLCRELGIHCVCVPPVEVELPGGTVTVSSTKIRGALAAGDTESADTMLGYSSKN